MTARIVTTLGALALGIAFAAAPAMAQNAGDNGAGMAAPSEGSGSMNQGAMTDNGMAPQMRPMHHHHMAMHGMSHAAMGHMGHMNRMARGGDTASGMAAVDRLNSQSLMAAKQGTNFMPGGMSEGGMSEGGMAHGGMMQGGMGHGGMMQGGMSHGGMSNGAMPEGGMSNGAMPEGGMQH